MILYQQKNYINSHHNHLSHIKPESNKNTPKEEKNIAERQRKRERLMEGYYYGYPRRNCSFFPYLNSNPVYYQQNPYYNANPNRDQNSYHNLNSRSKPTVVSIPIHFVNSDSAATMQEPVAPKQASPEMAVAKIQKVTRGFLVRKNFQVVRKIEDEAEAIWREIRRDEKILEKEVKARIRVGEMLMNLLLRLDSVRAVRDYRKKVIKKVISLQELVDSIAARAGKVGSDAIEVERSDVPVDSVQNPSFLHQIEEDKADEVVNQREEASIENKSTEQGNDPAHLGENITIKAAEAGNLVEESLIEPFNSTKSSQNQMDDPREEWNPAEEFLDAEGLGEVHNSTGEISEPDETDIKAPNHDDQAPELSQSVPVQCENDNNSSSNEMEMKGVRDVMERVVIESEKMKALMEELCQRTAQQWQLMEGLVNRVDRLEGKVERMERREKKKIKGSGRKRERLSRKCGQCE